MRYFEQARGQDGWILAKFFLTCLSFWITPRISPTLRYRSQFKISASKTWSIQRPVQKRHLHCRLYIWTMKASRLYQKSSQMASMDPHVGCLIFLVWMYYNWLTNSVGPDFRCLSQVSWEQGYSCLRLYNSAISAVAFSLLVGYWRLSVSNSLWWRSVTPNLVLDGSAY